MTKASICWEAEIVEVTALGDTCVKRTSTGRKRMTAKGKREVVSRLLLLLEEK